MQVHFYLIRCFVFILYELYVVGGELFSQREKDNLIELSVNSEGLRFLAKTNGKTYEDVINGDFIDNKWHTVLLNYILGNITLTVDGTDSLVK